MSQPAKTKRNPIYYFTTCGCKLHGKDLKKNHNILACREHGGLVLKRTRLCPDCEKEFTLKSVTGGSARCPECKKAYRAKYLRDRQKARYVRKTPITKKQCTKKPPQTAEQKKAHKESIIKSRLKQKMAGWSIDPIGDYCIHIGTCYAKGCVDCETCQKFEGVFFGHDPRLAIGA